MGLGTGPGSFSPMTPSHPDAALLIVGHGSTVNPDSGAPSLAHAAAIRRRGLFARVACVFWKEEPALRDWPLLFRRGRGARRVRRAQLHQRGIFHPHGHPARTRPRPPARRHARADDRARGHRPTLALLRARGQPPVHDRPAAAPRAGGRPRRARSRDEPAHRRPRHEPQRQQRRRRQAAGGSASARGANTPPCSTPTWRSRRSSPTGRS